jgi:hypothetical protein
MDERNELRELRDMLVEALQFNAGMPVRDDSPCHNGICSKEVCGRCAQILEVRELLARAKEVK